MREADMRRLAGRPTENLGSYDLYLRAFSIYASLSRADMRAALALLDRAIVLDPGYGAALALAAFCHVFLVASGWSDHPEAQLASARALIARALTSGRDDPEVLGGLAIAIGLLGEDREVPVSLADRAVEINPGSSQAWMASGFARTNMGEPALGFEHLETALRLDPLSQFRPNILAMQGYARFAQGRFREAVSLLKQSVRMQPEFLMAYVFLAAGHGHLGDKAAAREAIGSFQTVSDVDFHAFAAGYPDPKARSLVVEGIALAAADV
jgi:adenylate cyclase